MSIFKKIHKSVKKELKNAGDGLAKIDPSSKIADLVKSIGEEGSKSVLNQANLLASQAKASNAATDNNSCRIIVSTGLATWAATEGATGNPWKAAITAGGGAAAAQIACDRIFPTN